MLKLWIVLVALSDPDASPWIDADIDCSVPRIKERIDVDIATVSVGKLAMRVVLQTENSLFLIHDVLMIDDETRLAMEVVDDPSHNLD